MVNIDGETPAAQKVLKPPVIEPQLQNLVKGSKGFSTPYPHDAYKLRVWAIKGAHSRWADVPGLP
jgi:hypothetical protein